MGQAGEAVGEEGGADDEEGDKETPAPDPGEVVCRRHEDGVAADRDGMHGEAVEEGQRTEDAAPGDGGKQQGGRDFRPSKHLFADRGHAEGGKNGIITSKRDLTGKRRVKEGGAGNCRRVTNLHTEL